MSALRTYIRSYMVRIIIIIGILSGLISFYFVSPEAVAVATELQTWNSAAAAWTLFVGIITVFARYVRSIMKRTQYWQYRAYGIVLMVVWVIMGAIVGLYSDLYQTAFYSTKITLHIAILGQLVFFFTSGVYRTFRMKTFRTAIYAFFAMLLIIGNAPWMLATFPQVDKLTYWLLENPSMSGERTLALTGGIGGAVLGIRILLGLEKGALRATEAS